MPRIRTIKPEFWRNAELSQVSAEAALLAIGLLNVADDEGYFDANPKLIQADIFPLRECSMSTHVLLNELSRIGYVELFFAENGRQYGHVVNFTVHQVIQRKVKSKIKDLPRLNEDSMSTHIQLNEDSIQERKGKEREKEEEGNITPQAASRASRSKVLKPDDVSEQVWTDWSALRKVKKAEITQTAIDGIRREAELAGISFQTALQTMCERGWQGFKATWLKNESVQSGSAQNKHSNFAERDYGQGGFL